MKPINRFYLKIPSRSANESFARFAVSAFVSQLDPTLEELSDIKTAVSEAVTNSIVHAYKHKDDDRRIVIECSIERTETDGVLHIQITDFGVGILDIEKAVMPFYTTLADEERSGMGFTIMQTFMDEFSVESADGKGTTIRMQKRITGVAAPTYTDCEREREEVNA
jgi:stage II sporulation protein AB (anti-sigma F factor)